MEDDDFLLNTLSSNGRNDQTRVNFMEESLMSSSSPFGGGSRDNVRKPVFWHAWPSKYTG